MSQIDNFTSDVTVTSFQMASTPHLDVTSAKYSGMYVLSFVSLSYRLAPLSTQRKGGQLCAPPPQWPAGSADAQRPPG